MKAELPTGWTLASLGDIADIFNGKASGTGGSWLRVFKTRHIYNGFLRLADSTFAPDVKAPGVPVGTHLRAGDTLTPNMAHGTIGRVSFVRQASPNWTVDGQVMVIRSRDPNVLGRFTYDWMSRPESKAQLVAMEKGGAFDELRGQTHIYCADVRTIKILLPPLVEQTKITAILASVDEAIEATQAVIEQLQVVKKAMMAELLTRGLQGRHTRFKHTEIGEVPEDWEVTTVGDLLTETAYGTSAKCEASASGFPVLRIPNVVEERITTNALKYATLPPAEVDRYALRDGDLLVVRTNGNPNYVGRSAVVQGLPGTWLYASYLIRLRPKLERVSSPYLHQALRSERARETMRGAIRGAPRIFRTDC